MSFARELDYFSSLLPYQHASTRQKIFYSSALASSLLGVKEYWEIIAALALHIIAWQQGGQGPSVVYNYTAGIRLHRGDVRYAYLPLVVDAIDLLEMPQAHPTHIAHALALVLGYVSSHVQKRVRRKKTKVR